MSELISDLTVRLVEKAPLFFISVGVRVDSGLDCLLGDLHRAHDWQATFLQLPQPDVSM